MFYVFDSCSYYASTLFPQATPQPRAVKRPRLMTSAPVRPALAMATPQAQMVLQPQTQQQQLVAANKLTTAAANSLLQLQQQQQHILLANGNSVVSLCNSIQNQNYPNIGCGLSNGSKSSVSDISESGGQSNSNSSIAGQFKIYSKSTSDTFL
jgi:hypothetical protein